MPDVETPQSSAISPEKRRSAQVFNAELVSAFLAMLGTGCGIAFMLLFGTLHSIPFLHHFPDIQLSARANTCNTTGPTSNAKLGYYPPWSVLLTNNPSNCVLDCPKDCAGLYTEADALTQTVRQ